MDSVVICSFVFCVGLFSLNSCGVGSFALSIVTVTFELEAENTGFGNKSVVNTMAMAGQPPPQTSDTPQGLRAVVAVKAKEEPAVLLT